MPTQVTDTDFKTSVLDAKGLVVVDFWAPWCGPCRVMGPILEEISTEYKDKMKILKLNVDENQETSGQYQVMSIPTMMFFKDGKPVDSIIGAVPKNKVTEKIDTLL